MLNFIVVVQTKNNYFARLQPKRKEVEEMTLNLNWKKPKLTKTNKKPEVIKKQHKSSIKKKKKSKKTLKKSKTT